MSQKSDFVIYMHHHSISRSRSFRFHGTLEEAKIKADAEFGNEMSFYHIVIDDENIGLCGACVAERRVSDDHWKELA